MHPATADKNHALTPSRIVRSFTPNWFAATMGTGILAIGLGQFPDIAVLHVAGCLLWMLNIGLFALFSGIYAMTWLRHFDVAREMLEHPTMSMSLGCIPMGLATIVNGLLLFGIPLIGDIAIAIAAVLWWIDAALAMACGLAVPFLMFTRQKHAIEQMTAVWLLPVVACEVAAVSGGLLLPYLAEGAAQLEMLLLCYVLWACSVPLAVSLIAILMLRLAVHKLPDASAAASSWLALGPLGTGALAMLLCGENAPVVLASTPLQPFADAIGGASIMAGVLLWGYGFWWLAMASLITARYFRSHVPFNLGWWGYTFPLGVFSVATIHLADLFPLGLLRGLGIGLITALAVIWAVVMTRTVIGAWNGQLFPRPVVEPAAAVALKQAA